MQRICWRTRRLCSVLVVVALLFAHSAFAVAACAAQLHASRGMEATGHAAAHSGHWRENGRAHDHGSLCRMACEDEARSRDSITVPPLWGSTPPDVDFIASDAWPRPAAVASIGRLIRPVSPSPPPLPLTIVLSRFRE